ncbi:hypothetical protein L6164_010508 [Bauhinia variegata]|uniref:Uncharacterized protein n=1 Tax=Bauhinia variegata TaxID=167791 RepID=A0ACB9PMG8_BAUVA|nr:hypothetical protein L6164_010508 [Bauhinia variegata]
MAYSPFSILLIRRLSASSLNPKPTLSLSSTFLVSKPFSTSQDPASNLKPSSLSARLSYVFDQIDSIQKERSEKDQTLQRIRAWRESKNTQAPQNEARGPEPESGSAIDANPISAESKLEATVEGEKCSELMKNEVEVVHPWSEWIELMERLVQQNYFDHRRKDEDKMVRDMGFDPAHVSEDVGFDFTKDFKSVQTACLNFGKDRFDILRSLSRKDIQILVGLGCPTVDKKVVFSAKLLRKHVHLDEGDVCSSCSLRNTCERAYLLTNKEDEGRTIDVMRVLLTFGFDPLNGSVINKSLLKQKTVKTVVRKLLHEVVKFSSVPIDPNLPPPVIKKPPPKVKQPPPPKKRVGRDDIEMKKGDWLCPKCDFMNFAKNNVCLQCDAKRPKRQLLPGEWECPECNFLNYRRNMVCFHCECKRPPDEFLESKMQDKQHNSKQRMDKIAGRPEVSNAWNFDFDDDESDGADVAAFENADAHAIEDDSPSDSRAQFGNFRGWDGDLEKSNKVQGSHEGVSYTDPHIHRPGVGFDDFEDEDDIDSYELDTHNDSARIKVFKSELSEDEDCSGLEDIEDADDRKHARQGTTSSRRVQSSPMRKNTSFSGSDDDELDFDSDEHLSSHPNFKSSHVFAAGQKKKGRGSRSPAKKLSFGSESDEDIDAGLYSDEDGDLNEAYPSRQHRGKKLDSGRRNFSKDRRFNSGRRGNSFADEFDGSSWRSTDNGRGSYGNGRNWQRLENKKPDMRQLNRSSGGQFENKQRGRFNRYPADDKRDFDEFRNSRRVIENKKPDMRQLNRSSGGQFENKQRGRFNRYSADDKRDFDEFRNSRRVIER